MASVDPTGRSAVAVAAVQPTALAAAWAQRGGGFSGLKRTADLWFSTPASDCPCLRLRQRGRRSQRSVPDHYLGLQPLNTYIAY